MIEPGMQISIHYTVTLPDGTVVDTNQGQEPLRFVHGKQDILPELEQQLEGHRAGETVNIVLQPEQAYGHEKPHLLQEVPLSLVPKESRYIGALLTIQGNEQQSHYVRVNELHSDKAILNFNHLLAGLTLHFTVDVVDVT